MFKAKIRNFQINLEVKGGAWGIFSWPNHYQNRSIFSLTHGHYAPQAPPKFGRANGLFKYCGGEVLGSSPEKVFWPPTPFYTPFMVEFCKNKFWDIHMVQKYPCMQKISHLPQKLIFDNPLKLNLSSVH